MTNGITSAYGAFINTSSGVVANAAAQASLPAAPGKTNYLSGFEITGGGATLGGLLTVSISGLMGGTIQYVYGAVAGVLLANPPLVVNFIPPLPASGPNVAITIDCPALGLGNTANVISMHGFVA